MMKKLRNKRYNKNSIMHSRWAPRLVLSVLSILFFGVIGLAIAKKSEVNSRKLEELTHKKHKSDTFVKISNKKNSDNEIKLAENRKNKPEESLITKVITAALPPAKTSNKGSLKHAALEIQDSKDNKESQNLVQKLFADLRSNKKSKNTETISKSEKSSKTSPKNTQAKSPKTKKEKSSDKVKAKSQKTKSIFARITVYWAKGAGTDSWSAKNQSSTGVKLVCGQHAAVDPKVIPYGSKVKLKKGREKVIVKAVDTGGAVKSRKAAINLAKTPEQRKAPVIDLFFERKKDALLYAKNNPPYQWVDVVIPN